VGLLLICQYSLSANSYSLPKSQKFGLDINACSKILFYQFVKDFEAILLFRRKGCCFFMKCQITFFISEGGEIKVIYILQNLFWFFNIFSEKNHNSNCAKKSQNFFQSSREMKPWISYIFHMALIQWIRYILGFCCQMGNKNLFLLIRPILLICQNYFDG